MLKLFYISIFLFTVVVTKQIASGKRINYSTIEASISDAANDEELQRDLAIVDKKISQDGNIAFEPLPTDWEKLSKQSTAHSELANLARKPILKGDEIVVVESDDINIESSQRSLEEALNDFLKSDTFKNNPIEKGNFLMMMSNVEGLKEKVRDIALEVINEKEFNEPSIEDIKSQDDENSYLSDNPEHLAVTMAYESYLNTFDGEDIEIQNETYKIIESHTNNIIRRDIANSYINSFPHQYDSLVEDITAVGVKIEGLEKIDIPTSEE